MPPLDLISLTREEAILDLYLALAVIHPPIQMGRGRKLPHEGDEQRKRVATAIVEHFERQGVVWFRRAPDRNPGGFPPVKH